MRTVPSEYMSVCVCVCVCVDKPLHGPLCVLHIIPSITANEKTSFYPIASKVCKSHIHAVQPVVVH